MTRDVVLLCAFFRTQQSRSNEAEASQMERADAGCSGLLLRRIRCCKHRENALIKESLEDTPSSTRQPEGEDDGADESCGRSDPKRGSSEGKSWNIVRETISSEDFCLAKDKAVLPATSASCKQKGLSSGNKSAHVYSRPNELSLYLKNNIFPAGLPAGEQIMRTRQHGEENRPSSSSSTTRSSNTSVQADSSNDTIRKPDQSNGTIITLETSFNIQSLISLLHFAPFVESFARTEVTFASLSFSW